ncbi:peptidylprolyl isomerase [Ollibium composti]|jgi:peptidyl-prolyl cis-trans isomerase C|uniref:Parvulin-like PPIase n=1 Tax=Ollibium composti TaxID=2675109 RepID=A0ABY2Q3H6_9HYPH|nr:peptidylprolyl isomerase [Mesorhizobium composti]THF55522.1 peptidylprolyl isomerase [Mesorhizobium composti]
MILSVNGMAVAVEADALPEFAAARELLRQRAVEVGLLDAAVEDEAEIDSTIEALLEKEVATPVPTEAECRRYYEQNPTEFESGDLVHARHILFQVTPQVNVPQMRARAEEALNTLLAEPDRFAAMAAELSNCPSGEQGGNLGQVSRGDMVPEFEKALFKFGASGILRDLVKTRYGFHIVAVDQRIPGHRLPFDVVQEQIAARLRSRVEEKALRQYVSVLAGQAEIEGVQLEASESPLVQ